LYGSESEIEESEVDEPTMLGHGGPNQKFAKAQKKSKSQVDSGTRLRVDDDEPMDLLEGAAGNFTSTHFITDFAELHLRCSNQRLLRNVTGSLVKKQPSSKQMKIQAR
jgi:hypothetical protein